METMQAILTRRSIRRFAQKPVSKDALTAIVRAGAHAATGGNRQKWRFVAVSEAGKVAGTTDALGWLNAWYPPDGMTPAAHVVALAPADASASVLSDSAAAMQNMALAAWDAGIGSCWFGSVKREQLARVLGVPADWQIFAVLALGYPAEESGTVEGADTKVTREATGRVIVPKKPLRDILSFDGF